VENQVVKVGNGLQVFESEKFGKVKGVVLNDTPGGTQMREAISRLDENEKNTVSLNDGTPGNPNIINPDVGLTTQGVDTVRTLNDSNGLRAVK